MQAGIAVQVSTIFGLFSLELYIRYTRSSATARPTSQPQYSTQFKNSILALIIAYFAILIRYIYRVAEMAGG